MFAFMRQQGEPILTPENALPGRSTPMTITEPHFVNGHRLKPLTLMTAKKAMFGMGCFWGAERLFWELSGVHVTAVGYAAGHTPNPTYEEVCSGMTGHNEVVLVVYNQNALSYNELLKTFGRDTTRHKVCVKAMTSALNIEAVITAILQRTNGKQRQVRLHTRRK